MIANDDIFHLPALSELVVKCRPQTFISVDVAPTIQPHSSQKGPTFRLSHIFSYFPLVRGAWRLACVRIYFQYQGST